jgi:hypothetical protein
MIKTTYCIEHALYNSDEWFGSRKFTNKREAIKEYNRIMTNSKGNLIIIDLKSRLRLRKITEEVLVMENQGF